MPPKQAESAPWEKLCVDLIGPYTIINAHRKEILIHAVTMIDPATSWFELKLIPNKTALEVANVVEQTWLTRYPWPQEITNDQGSEFMAEFADMIENDYQITKRPATTRNPQSNSIIERVHQTIGDMLRTFELPKSEIEGSMALKGIFSVLMFAVHSTYHTMLKLCPCNLYLDAMQSWILNFRPIGT